MMVVTLSAFKFAIKVWFVYTTYYYIKGPEANLLFDLGLLVSLLISHLYTILSVSLIVVATLFTQRCVYSSNTKETDLVRMLDHKNLYIKHLESKISQLEHKYRFNSNRVL